MIGLMVESHSSPRSERPHMELADEPMSERL